MLASATELRERFADLCEKPIEKQTQFFLRSFVYELKDVAEVMDLQEAFVKYLSERNEESDLSPIQAANFLEKNGKTRTALQRKKELADVDLDQNGRISFIEYLLLHYKDGIGLTGVGNELLTELYNIADGIPIELQRQVDAFMEAQREREAKIEKLKEVVATAGRVQAGKAAHELKILTSSDWDDEKRQLQAAVRMAKDRAGSSTVIVAKQKAETQRKKVQQLKTAKSKLQLMQEQYKNNARKGVNATIHRA